LEKLLDKSVMMWSSLNQSVFLEILRKSTETVSEYSVSADIATVHVRFTD